MAAAQIRIDQAGNSAPTGVPGVARDDITRGAPVTLRNADNTGVKTWAWRLISRPYGSAATISGPTSAVCNFTPDVFGSYLFELRVNNGLAGELVQLGVIVRDPAGLALPAPHGRANSANYLISPGVYNVDGWAREMNERQLRASDQRSGVLTLTVATETTEILAIEWGLPMGIVQCLEVVGDTSTDSAIGLAANAAGTAFRALWPSEDVTGDGFATWTPVTMTGAKGTALEGNKVYLVIRNNDVATCVYTIYIRIKAP